MTDQQNPQNPIGPKPTTPNINKIDSSSKAGSSYSGKKPHYPNPPESGIPDAATLREQWKFAIRQYSKWYSHAWGTAILAGASFFALGWWIKGSNPLPSRHEQPDHNYPPPTATSNEDTKK